ncbi:MAG: ribonuclease III [Clostridia bacterium]|nr:ribonuclease III [Clostridia bacterium]
MIFDISEAENRIKYTFKDKILLRQAFTHSSYSNENNALSNERMEFLGDALLNFIIADFLYKKYPDIDEGELTQKRSSLVSAKPLSEAACGLKLEELILLGEGEKKSAYKSVNISADLFESVTAAIYLDGGIANAARFIKYALRKNLSGKNSKSDIIDYKSELSEYSQKKYGKKAKYKLIKQEGYAHMPSFTIAAIVDGKEYSPAKAESKKQAQQLAAENALNIIKNKLTKE